MHLGQVSAAVPADGKLRELFDCPVILFVGLSELLNIEPRLDGVRRDVERLVEKFLVGPPSL